GAQVFDIFTGASLGEGRKSVAIEVTLQPTTDTMSDEDIDSVISAIADKVAKATGGEVRGR
ncbi:MAG: hypothetical protein AAFO79_09160, partial [Pseudomonadota bacterium]